MNDFTLYKVRRSNFRLIVVVLILLALILEGFAINDRKVIAVGIAYFSLYFYARKKQQVKLFHSGEIQVVNFSGSYSMIAGHVKHYFSYNSFFEIRATSSKIIKLVDGRRTIVFSIEDEEEFLTALLKYNADLKIYRQN